MTRHQHPSTSASFNRWEISGNYANEARDSGIPFTLQRFKLFRELQFANLTSVAYRMCRDVALLILVTESICHLLPAAITLISSILINQQQQLEKKRSGILIKCSISTRNKIISFFTLHYLTFRFTSYVSKWIISANKRLDHRIVIDLFVLKWDNKYQLISNLSKFVKAVLNIF